jgi:hypothetical protein
MVPLAFAYAPVPPRTASVLAVGRPTPPAVIEPRGRLDVATTFE